MAKKKTKKEIKVEKIEQPVSKQEEQLSLTEESLKNAVASVKDKGYKLFVACPMYGGMCHGLFMLSCLGLQNIMNANRVETKFSFLFNESLITRARNYLVDEFLRSDCTHMIFIDADIHFDPNDVLVLLALEKELVGGPYPKKSINWDAIANAVKKNPDMDPNKLENLVGNFVFNLDKNTPVGRGEKKLLIYDPTAVLEIGTGYMMIKREVFDKMKEKLPSIKYRPDHTGQENFDGSRYIHAYFDTIIDTKESLTGGGTDRYLSEDYMFCQMWRKIGGTVYLCPWMKTKHIGSYAFTGDLAAIALASGK
jgi:hypothetical protein